MYHVLRFLGSTAISAIRPEEKIPPILRTSRPFTRSAVSCANSVEERARDEKNQTARFIAYRAISISRARAAQLLSAGATRRSYACCRGQLCVGNTRGPEWPKLLQTVTRTGHSRRKRDSRIHR